MYTAQRSNHCFKCADLTKKSPCDMDKGIPQNPHCVYWLQINFLADFGKFAQLVNLACRCLTTEFV